MNKKYIKKALAWKWKLKTKDIKIKSLKFDTETEFDPVVLIEYKTPEFSGNLLLNLYELKAYYEQNLLLL